MFKKKLPQWSMLPAEVEVTHFYGTQYLEDTAIGILVTPVQKMCVKMLAKKLCLLGKLEIFR
jgi:hypothetical protein